ncbi:hypothetical protein ACWD64_20065 [Streptomyces antibioticus]
MSARRIYSADQAFQAGFDAPCEHLVPSPVDCPHCRLTDAEISRLAVLLRDAHGSTESLAAQAA